MAAVVEKKGHNGSSLVRDEQVAESSETTQARLFCKRALLCGVPFGVIIHVPKSAIEVDDSFSNMRVNVSGFSSSALKVIESLSPNILRIDDMFFVLIPKVFDRSHRNSVNPLAANLTLTRETCAESMDWIETSSSETSRLQSVTRSLIASMMSLKMEPDCNCASNMVT